MADDDIEVLVEDEPPVVDPDEIGDPEPAKKVEAKAPVTKPEDGVEVLKQQLEAEKAGRAEDQRRAEVASRETVAAKTEVQQTNIQLVEQAIREVKANLDNAEAMYADAMAAGDFVGGAKIQRQMAADAAKQLTLENGLEGLKNAPPPRAAPPTDPVEAFVATLTPLRLRGSARTPSMLAMRG